MGGANDQRPKSHSRHINTHRQRRPSEQEAAGSIRLAYSPKRYVYCLVSQPFNCCCSTSDWGCLGRTAPASSCVLSSTVFAVADRPLRCPTPTALHAKQHTEDRCNSTTHKVCPCKHSLARMLLRLPCAGFPNAARPPNSTQARGGLDDQTATGHTTRCRA